MRYLGILFGLAALISGCGSVNHIHTITQVKHVTVKGPPEVHKRGMMTRAEYEAIQIDEPAGVIGVTFPQVRNDSDASGDTPIPSADGTSVYDIIWDCHGDDKHCANQTVKDKKIYPKDVTP